MKPANKQAGLARRRTSPLAATAVRVSAQPSPSTVRPANHNHAAAERKFLNGLLVPRQRSRSRPLLPASTIVIRNYYKRYL